MPLNDEIKNNMPAQTAGEKLKRDLEQITPPKTVLDYDYADYFGKIKSGVRSRASRAGKVADVVLRSEPESEAKSEGGLKLKSSSENIKNNIKNIETQEKSEPMPDVELKTEPEIQPEHKDEITPEIIPEIMPDVEDEAEQETAGDEENQEFEKVEEAEIEDNENNEFYEDLNESLNEDLNLNDSLDDFDNGIEIDDEDGENSEDADNKVDNENVEDVEEEEYEDENAEYAEDEDDENYMDGDENEDNGDNEEDENYDIGDLRPFADVVLHMEDEEEGEAEEKAEAAPSEDEAPSHEELELETPEEIEEPEEAEALEDLTPEEPEEPEINSDQFEEAELVKFEPMTAEQKLMNDLASAMQGPPLTLETPSVETEPEQAEEIAPEAEPEQEDEIIPEIEPESEPEAEEISPDIIDPETESEAEEIIPEIEPESEPEQEAEEIVPEDFSAEETEELELKEEISSESSDEEINENEENDDENNNENNNAETLLTDENSGHKTAEDKLMEELTAMGAVIPNHDNAEFTPEVEPDVNVSENSQIEIEADEAETPPENELEPEQEFNFEPEMKFEPEPEPEDMAELMTDINDINDNSGESEELQDMEEDISAVEEPVNNVGGALEMEEEFAPWLAPEQEAWTPAVEPEADENLNNAAGAVAVNNLINKSGEDAQREKDMNLRERLLSRKNNAAAPVQDGAVQAKSSGGWKGRAIMAFLLLLLVIGAGMCWWELHNFNLRNSDGGNSGVNSETAMKIQNLLNNLESQNKEIKTYEYAVEFLVDSNITAGMAARGANGWQVVGSRRSQDTGTGQYGYEFIFMRPVSR